MIKVKAIEDFNFSKMDKIKNLKRAVEYKNKSTKIYENDTFLCDKKMAKYLLGDNDYKRPFIQILEVGGNNEQ